MAKSIGRGWGEGGDGDRRTKMGDSTDLKTKKVVGVLDCAVRKRKLAFTSWKTFIRPGAGTRLLTSKKLLVKQT